MSGYSRRKVASHSVAEPAVHKPKKADELKKGEQCAEKCLHCEIQHYPQDHKCALQNIKISNVCSLSKVSFHDNSSVASAVKEGDLDPASCPNDLKLSESDVNYIHLESHSESELSNKPDCNIREVGAWRSENVSTVNHKDNNLKESIVTDLTEEGGISNEPKRSVTPKVSSPVSKFSSIKTRSTANSKQTGIETRTRNSDAQRGSKSSVGHSIEPSDNKSRPNSEENREKKSFDKKFCCVLSWTASIYGQPLECSCASEKNQGGVTQSSTSVKQLGLHVESCRDYVLIRDLDNTSTVQKETSPPQLSTQGQHKLPHKKRQESNGKSQAHNQNKETRQTYSLRKLSAVGQRKSQTLELSEGENSNSFIQTSGEGRHKLPDREEKAALAHTTRNMSDFKQGQKTLNDNKKKSVQSEQSVCARNEGGSPYVHSKSSSSIHYQNTGPEANTEPQSLPFNREDLSNWTDRESETLTHLALDKRDINPDPSSEGNAVINQGCSNEGGDKPLNNIENLMKQFDQEYKSFLYNYERSYRTNSAIPSDDETNDKATEKIQSNTRSTEFCCMLGWSAQISGEPPKCSCATFEIKDKLPLIDDTKTGGTRSADQSSSPPAKSEGNICENSVEHIETNWKSKECITGDRSAVGKSKSQTNNTEGNCELALDLKNSPTHDEQNVPKKSLDRTPQFRESKDRSPKAELSDETLEVDNNQHCRRNKTLDSSFMDSLQVLPGKEDQILSSEKSTICTPTSEKRSIVSGHISTQVLPAKSNCSDTSENISSEKAPEIISSPQDVTKDPLLLDNDFVAQGICNLDVHIQEAKGAKLISTCQTTQKDITIPHMLTSTSGATFDTRETFSDVQTENKNSQLRKLDAVQGLSKTECTLGNQISSPIVVEQNINDFSVLPQVQELTGEMPPKIVSQCKRDSFGRFKKKTRSNPSETTKTPTTSSKESHNLGLDEQNISSAESSELPPSPQCRPKCCFISDNSKPGECQEAKNKHNVKTPKENEDEVVKSSQNILFYEESSEISPKKTHSEKSNADLQTKIVSHIGHLDSRLETEKLDDSIVKYSNDEITPATQETKCSDDDEKLGNKDKLDHIGNLHERKRKANIPGSESGSGKRSKSAQSEQNAPSAEMKPVEMAALPTCDDAVKTPDASSTPTSQPSLQEKVNLKQCVVKLYRLPFPLDGKLPMNNPSEISKNCNVDSKDDSEQIKE
ncbi:uncharacterized protein ACNLHF_000537 isoform 1-T3 [Anomaloglossus baeobatrachus]|uniref:uncharacterized protein LOC142250983 n=1 Tax=Anomaloglossus baeobatrachus TaxID=238106 RepID=UPI003F4FF0E4